MEQHKEVRQFDRAAPDSIARPQRNGISASWPCESAFKSSETRRTDREKASERKERVSSSPQGCGGEFEQCLPRGVIFYSLCPSVAWPGALRLTVSALNTADTDSSEPRHT